jgi:2-polyprenyl-3-methyl-5-hydroxy-6-metoxy-1,4-benzoquinol methylase
MQNQAPGAEIVSESDVLAKVASRYHKEVIAGWSRLYEKKWAHSYKRLLEHLPHRTSALELGCADGQMSEHLAADFESLTVVDGSQEFLALTKNRLTKGGLGNVQYAHSLFEDYSTKEQFDAVFLCHVLEHVEDPIALLKTIKPWVAPRGGLAVLVPNANSLHRLAGVRMGMLQQNDSLNNQDVVLGHRRVYSPELLKAHCATAGLEITAFGGVMVKPLSNRQIEEQWSDALIEAYLEMGRDLPELSSEIFVICR